MQNIEQKSSQRLVAGGPNLNAPLEFRAWGVYVGNYTAQWVEIPDAGEFVPPNTRQVIPMPGVVTANATFAAPPGVVQPVAVAGQTCFLTFTERNVQSSGGLVGATAVASQVTLEQFAKIALPASGNKGRLVELTTYNRGLWIDDGTTFSSITHEVFDVKNFDALGDGVADDTLPIQNAIAAAGVSGGIVWFPPGKYKTTATIYVPKLVHIRGSGRFGPGLANDGVSSIVGTHTGAAVVSLKGALGCSIADITLVGSAVTTPLTGLCLGRNSASSAGLHYIHGVNVTGNFTKAGLYAIASEENTFVDVSVILLGGGAKYARYLAQSDILAVDGLVASSNVNNRWISCRFDSRYATDDTGAPTYIDASGSSGALTDIGCYSFATRGAFYILQVGATDGLSGRGPFTFIGCSGEIPTGTGPIYGFRILTAGALSLYGLTIDGGRYNGNAATFLSVAAANVTLDGALVKVNSVMAGFATLTNAAPAQLLQSSIEGLGSSIHVPQQLVSRYVNNAALNITNNVAGTYVDFGGGFTVAVTTLAGDTVVIRVQSVLVKQVGGTGAIVVDRSGTKLPAAGAASSVILTALAVNIPFLLEYVDTPAAGAYTYKPQLFTSDANNAFAGNTSNCQMVVEVWR